MKQENIRKETFLATLLLLAGTLILWKGYSYEPDSRQFMASWWLPMWLTTWRVV
ncbi:hypothetical protein [Parasutterella excrementihominis]|uniref:hypothetical protein n=1 Tax=Parasutterella excrementihominis TaxID=487175 RepID=UPI003F7343EB